jgi:hypothetical protein
MRIGMMFDGIDLSSESEYFAVTLLSWLLSAAPQHELGIAFAKPCRSLRSDELFLLHWQECDSILIHCEGGLSIGRIQT